jgi:transposase-like protein
MPPGNKIPDNTPGSKNNLSHPPCPFCGFPRCWKHGTYRRKGFHQRQNEPLRELVAVQRYLCRSSPCDRTFSELPDEVLPYCRFFMGGLLSIASDLTEGKSSYWIAKYQWGLSLRVVLRAVSLIRKVTPWLEGLCREVAGSVTPGLQALITTIRKKVFRRDFIRRWFHALYPCRAGNIFNPHNVVIKRF